MQPSPLWIEMLIVLMIISVLMLLFVPNLSKQKNAVDEKGKAAVVKVVDSQAELYELNNGQKPTLSILLKAGHISEKQLEAYNSYYKEREGRQVAN